MLHRHLNHQQFTLAAIDDVIGRGKRQDCAELRHVALDEPGWKTARVQWPVQILGSLDGIETGVWQLLRDEPLETTQVECFGHKLTIPTEAEVLRIPVRRRLVTRSLRDFAPIVGLTLEDWEAE